MVIYFSHDLADAVSFASTQFAWLRILKSMQAAAQGSSSSSVSIPKQLTC
jgi:hypothetical protein